MSKVAIITPVYNSEKYLPEMIESVLSQTHNDFELILVDDGSTDKSLEICEEYARNDKRIIVFKSNHVGVSTARNIGFEHIKENKDKYSFYCFVDSDDTIEKSYLEIMIKPLVDNPTINICLSAYTRDDYNYDDRYEIIPSNNLYKYRSKYPVPGNCNACKMFRISLIDSMKFPDGRFHEDVFIIPKTILKQKEIIVCYFKLYFYRVVSGSTTNSGWNSKKVDRLDALESNMAYVFENDIDAKSFFVNVYFEYLRLCIDLTKQLKLLRERKLLKKRLSNSVKTYKKEIANSLGSTMIIALKHGYNSFTFKIINTLKKKAKNE